MILAARASERVPAARQLSRKKGHTMSMIKQTENIPDAATVRRLLKERGFTHKVSIRRCNSPFSGMVFFDVSMKIPEGVTLITSGSSDRPGTQYGSSDGGKHASLLVELDRVLFEMKIS